MKLDSAIRAVRGRGLPLRGNDIDTDRIIPARYMKSITFEGLGPFAFYDERRDQSGALKKHPFNEPGFAGASILLVNRNFGCGSSREHAPQALYRSGIRAVIGESFAEIFLGNCTAMGLPAATLAPAALAELQAAVETDPGLELSFDLETSTLKLADGRSYPLGMAEAARRSLIEGSWDSAAVLLANKNAILAKAKELPYVGNFA